MKKNRSRFIILSRYIGSEYVLSFLVAFIFFFFIFFINQILVLAQKIMLKNVTVSDVISLVILSIPQFLMYTMPFSSLASASMVIGSFSSDNEILAMRSCGIHQKKIFAPIIVISIIFSAITLFIADKMIPFTAQKYREMYASILTKVPTVELESFGTTQFGKRIITNGPVNGSTIQNILILDDSDSSDSRIISAESATISVVDLDKFLYRIDLVRPEVLMTDDSSLDTYSIAKAESMRLYIDLSSKGSGYTSINPSQMSLGELRAAISEKEKENTDIIAQGISDMKSSISDLSESLSEIEDNPLQNTKTWDALTRYENIEKNKPFSFYYQYFRSELQKKWALAIACTVLVFVAFPISFFRIKYGRLIGFGLSMLIACLYWFFIYFMHTRAVMSPVNPAVFLWIPDITSFLIGIFLLVRLSKQ